MKKLIIDCSKPNGEREILLDLTSSEIASLSRQEDTIPPPPSEIEIRLSALEAKAGITEKDHEDAKAALVESLKPELKE